MSVVAFDPGVRNLAVWAGTLSEEGWPVTQHIAKYDLMEGGKKGAVYEAAVDLVLNTPWMSDPSQVKEAVVETQAPRNMPARIAATAIYGALRGRGIKTRFSGAQLKNKTMASMAARLGCSLKEKPQRLVGAADAEKAKRRREMHSVNKYNSVLIAKKVLERCKDEEVLAALTGAKNPTSKQRKPDDLADALLLGVGQCLENSVKGSAKRKPIKEVESEEEDASNSDS